jgi:multicomponent Na+:H+ antiporter subunit E
MLESEAMMIAPARTSLLFCFWMILAGPGLAEVLVGIAAAVSAAAVSLKLLPPGHWRLHPLALARLVLRFLRQSIAAGIDVSWRALHPRPSLRPGFVTYRPQILQGPAQTAFCTVMSLVPGTLPSGWSENGSIVVHCLDVDQPIAAQAAVEEGLLARALGVRPNDE